MTDGLVEMVLMAAKPQSIMISIMPLWMSMLNGAVKMAVNLGLIEYSNQITLLLLTMKILSILSTYKQSIYYLDCFFFVILK